MTPVCDEKAKAKDGYTRVYVEINEGVQRYYDELPKRFLHLSHDPSQVGRSFLPKATLCGSNDARLQTKPGPKPSIPAGRC